MSGDSNKTYSFSDADVAELSDHDISLDEAERQIELLLKPARNITLSRACTIGDGISFIEETEHASLIEAHEEAALSGRFTKFVPASGAASRMFRELLLFVDGDKKINFAEIEDLISAGNKDATALKACLNSIQKFAFREDLASSIKKLKSSLDDCLKKEDHLTLLRAILKDEGLGYSQLPKGLIKFHFYEDGARTAFEEHLVEAALTVKDKSGNCRLHFTVSPEHQSKFLELLSEKQGFYEKKWQAKFIVEFSLQKLSTDMLALGLDKNPFHDENGHLLLRPGGHGALIENLNDLKADIIFVKNIDNVQPDNSKPLGIKYKKLLSGYLLRVQKELFSHLRKLHSNELSDAFLEEALLFARKSLCVAIPDAKWATLSSHQARRDFLIRKLDRPLRVCGVVKNTGEPGGGPFWVAGDDGVSNLQIVEGAQIDNSAPTQSKIFYTSTHFNPVDLVCAVRNFRGQVFDLRKYVDPSAVILTHKSYQGRDLIACERPGLWNGSMSDWITLFVEVPEETFTPVKTLNDLLRPCHQ